MLPPAQPSADNHSLLTSTYIAVSTAYLLTHSQPRTKCIAKSAVCWPLPVGFRIEPETIFLCPQDGYQLPNRANPTGPKTVSKDKADSGLVASEKTAVAKQLTG